MKSRLFTYQGKEYFAKQQRRLWSSGSYWTVYVRVENRRELFSTFTSWRELSRWFVGMSDLKEV